MRAILVVIAALLHAGAASMACAETRVKDIVTVQGVRSNQLIGYGLVIGLNGTGDTLRNAPFTQQSLQSMLDRMGVNVRNTQARTRNVAAVMVTAELPANIGKGSRIDVTVSSLGDASSLMGGSLILTPLLAGDNQVYAVAQGPLAVSGFTSGGKAETVTQGVPTTGRIPNGGCLRYTSGACASRRTFFLSKPGQSERCVGYSESWVCCSEACRGASSGRSLGR